jgi:hypothetical protein
VPKAARRSLWRSHVGLVTVTYCCLSPMSDLEQSLVSELDTIESESLDQEYSLVGYKFPDYRE